MLGPRIKPCVVLTLATMFQPRAKHSSPMHSSLYYPEQERTADEITRDGGRAHYPLEFGMNGGLNSACPLSPKKACQQI